MNDFYNNLYAIIKKVPRSIFVIIILGIIILIPFPQTITGKFTLVALENADACAVGELPLCYIQILQNGMPVKLEMEGFTNKNDATVNGFINYIDSKREDTLNGFFSYTILLSSTPFMHKGMKGKVYIKMPYKSLLGRSVALLSNR